MMTVRDNVDRLNWPLPTNLNDHAGLCETTPTVCINLQETDIQTKATPRIDSALSHISAALRDYGEDSESLSSSDAGSVRSADLFDFDGLDSCHFGQGPIFGSVAPRSPNDLRKETLLHSIPPGQWLVGGEWSQITARMTLRDEELSAPAPNTPASDSFEDSLKVIERQKNEALQELVRYGSGEVEWKKGFSGMDTRRSSSVYSREPWDEKSVVRNRLTWNENYEKGERRKGTWMVEEDYTNVDVGPSVEAPRLGLGAKLKRFFTLRKSKTW